MYIYIITGKKILNLYKEGFSIIRFFYKGFRLKDFITKGFLENYRRIPPKDKIKNLLKTLAKTFSIYNVDVSLFIKKPC